MAIMVLPLLMLASACDQTTMPTGTEDARLSENSFAIAPFNLQHSKVNGSVAAQLAEVRRHTAQFQRVENAVEAGYVNVNVGTCVEHPELGGMGYHFVNFPLVGAQEDLDITRPQAILYEPQKNGRYRLIGVEYITEPGNPDIDAPTLFGEKFHWNPMQGFWALHVWIWKNNPSGMFADWNPNVSCDYDSLAE